MAATPSTPTPSAAPAKTQLYSHFTKDGGTAQLLTAGGQIRVTLTLEDAGPVSVGTSNALEPVLSGRGMLLPTEQKRIFRLNKGEILYIAAEGRNRVSVIIEPAEPEMEEMIAQLKSTNSKLDKLIKLSGGI